MVKNPPSKTSPQKAVTYCRVSSQRQLREGHGIASQDTRCREYARHKGYEVIKSFHDEGLSGKLLDRPQIKEMLTFLRKHKNDRVIVIIDDISRLARDIETHIHLRTAITQAGGKLESPSIEFGEDSDSRLVEHLLASVAAHQREKNAEQVTNRMRARVMNGYWIASPPLGYKYDKVEGHGKLLVPREPYFSIIKEALEGYANGRFETHSEVKIFLESQEGFPKTRDGQVRFQAVADILARPIYAGRLTFPDWGIHNHPGKHQAMITFEDWLRIQNRSKANAKAPARKDINEDFPLRGFVTCGGCGESLTSGWSRGRNKHYGYYLCNRKHCIGYGKSLKKLKLRMHLTNC